MQKTWLFSSALLLGIAAAQTSSTPNATGTASDQSGQSTTANQNPANTSNGTNKNSASQTGTTGTSGNTSAVGSSSANPSTPSSNSQSSTNGGANNAYPADQNSAAGSDQLGTQATATGASTGVGVSANPKKNKKAAGIETSIVPRNDQANTSAAPRN